MTAIPPQGSPGTVRRGSFRVAAASDVVIVGSGVAGLSAALAAVPATVTVVTKTGFGAGNSMWAQGGVAAALAADDSPELHALDTMAAGGGLNDPQAVQVLTTEGPDRARALLALGARFDRDADGRLSLAREAAHTVRRVAHAADATGAEIVDTLRRSVLAHPGIGVLEHHDVVDLVVEDGRVAGVVVQGGDGGFQLLPAGAVVLATGGSGQLYEVTTNPREATADGLALAARAGATLRDLEFVQFHPTALVAPGADPSPLVTEALRGEGATLIDETGRRFMTSVHPDAELAPRDVVARAVARHRLDGHTVFLDCTTGVGAAFPDRFPTVFASCMTHGIDPRTQPIPVSPAAHYHMGGVVTTLDGRTDVAGLVAAGEVAATGVHGANRLASNSLLEALVFGARAGRAAASDAASAGRPSLPTSPDALGRRFGRPLPGSPALSAETATAVRRILWRNVGLVRDDGGIRRAITALDFLERPDLDLATANLVLVARLLARAALMRTESRGAHYRSDHPAPDPDWAQHLDVRLVDGDVVLTRSNRDALVEAA